MALSFLSTVVSIALFALLTPLYIFVADLDLSFQPTTSP